MCGFYCPSKLEGLAANADWGVCGLKIQAVFVGARAARPQVVFISILFLQFFQKIIK
jgi:hypothetical protein